MAHEVFICYASRDQAVAEAVRDALESKNVKCWFAPRDVLPGTEWAETIVDALDESHILVLVLSSSSNTSPQVIREIGRAASNDTPIIPFRIDDVVPSKAIDYFVSSHHWLDAQTSPLDKHLQRLVGIVQQIQARKRAPREAIEIQEAEEKAKREAEEAKKAKEAEAAAKAARPMTHCPKCGAELRPNVSFCPKCGTRVSEAKKVKEAEERARREAEEAKKAKEAEEKAKREAEEAKERAKREAEEARKAKEAEEKAKREAEAAAKAARPVTHCLKCGAELRPNTSFCYKCGARVGKARKVKEVKEKPPVFAEKFIKSLRKRWWH